jgi:hypothetical protein
VQKNYRDKPMGILILSETDKTLSVLDKEDSPDGKDN